MSETISLEGAAPVQTGGSREKEAEPIGRLRKVRRTRISRKDAWESKLQNIIQL